MNWIEIKEKIYYCDGSLRDLYVLHTNIEDHKKWIHFINKKYTIQWFNGHKQTYEKKISLKTVEDYLHAKHDLCSTASIFIGKIQINNHFFAENEIENDLSPNEINSFEDHQKILQFMQEISILLDKPVILTPENEQETIYICVTKKQIEYFPKNKD